MSERLYHFAFAYENAQGHVTFARHLRRVVDADPTIDSTWLPLDLSNEGGLENLPPFKQNLSLRLSLRTRLALGRGSYDAILVHTQQNALLSGRVMRSTPTVLSTDATPINVDDLGIAYAHRVGPDWEESLKRRITAAALRRAAKVVPWSEWCGRSLTGEYGLDPVKMEVIPAGIPMDRWSPRSSRDPGRTRLLFVGTKFARKGGPELFDALGRIEGDWEIHVVNRDDDIPDHGRTVVHRDLSPDDDRLLRVFQQSDIFVFPTIGDASPWVVLEAMATGLPVVATAVGAIPEMVVDGTTGLLVEVGDVASLTEAIQALIDDPERRERMGAKGRERATSHYDSSRTSTRLIEAMKEVASGAPA